MGYWDEVNRDTLFRALPADVREALGLAPVPEEPEQPWGQATVDGPDDPDISAGNQQDSANPMAPNEDPNAVDAESPEGPTEDGGFKTWDQNGNPINSVTHGEDQPDDQGPLGPFGGGFDSEGRPVPVGGEDQPQPGGEEHPGPIDGDDKLPVGDDGVPGGGQGNPGPTGTEDQLPVGDDGVPGGGQGQPGPTGIEAQQPVGDGDVHPLDHIGHLGGGLSPFEVDHLGGLPPLDQYAVYDPNAPSTPVSPLDPSQVPSLDPSTEIDYGGGGIPDDPYADLDVN